MKNPSITLALLASALVAGACGDGGSEPLGPVDRAECTIGSIVAGQAREFTLGGATGCASLDAWRGDSVRSASYTVRLQAGQLYAFRAVEKDVVASSDFDITLSLFGPGADTSQHGWLTASDDEWGSASGYAPQVLFVPPVTGSYAVRVSGYNAGDTARAVRVVSEACAWLGTRAEASFEGVLPTTGCVVSSEEFSLDPDVDSTRVTGFALALDAGDQRRVRVISQAFQPTVYLAGPGPDIWWTGTIDMDMDRARAFDDTATVYVSAPEAGTYSVFVGAAEGARAGAFKVLVDEDVGPALVAERAAPVRKRERKAAR